MVDDDVELVSRCLNAERKAFESIVDKYQKIVFNVALRIINDSDDAEDVTQSVFIKVFENLSKYNPQYKFFSWLYRIALNEAINFQNQRRYHEALESNDVPDKDTPENVFTKTEILQSVENAIMKLDIDYRVVIVLRHFQELSYTEISKILDIPEKTVKSRLFTARQILKDILLKNQALL